MFSSTASCLEARDSGRASRSETGFLGAGHLARSPWAAILFLLSGAGFVFLRNEGREKFRQEEVSLILWLVLGLALYLLSPQPTFTQYFHFAFPASLCSGFGCDLCHRFEYYAKIRSDISSAGGAVDVFV